MSNLATASATAEIMNPIISATRETFAAMAELEVHRMLLEKVSPEDNTNEITAVIQLSGVYRGSVCLSLGEELAKNLVDRVLGIQVAEIDGIVRDTVGEFANVIAGSAKDHLQHLNLELGLPSIVEGTDYRISFPSEATPLRLVFNSVLGGFTILFGLATS